MKNLKKFLFLIIPIVFLIVLINQYNINHPKKNTFSIYLVKNLDLKKDMYANLETLKLEKEPIMEISNIEKYYWKDTNVNGFIIDKHSLKLKEPLKFSSSGAYIQDMIPFVLMINGKRFCLVCFSHPRTPIPYPKYIEIAISQGDNLSSVYPVSVIYAKNKNILNDKRIYKILRKYHKI